MSSKLIIGVCGYKRVGKDTIADYLCINHAFEKMKFAAPLKEMCKLLFNFSDEQLETNLKEDIDQRWNISPRKAMQFLGTEIMQYKISDLLPDIGRSFWARKLIDDIDNSSYKRVVISDLRFVHEYNLLKDKYRHNFVVVRVEKESPCDPMDIHSSEVEWKSIKADYIIYNNSDKDTLFSKTDKVMDAITSSSQN